MNLDTYGAVRVVATYRCEWCDKTVDHVVVFEETPGDRSTTFVTTSRPHGWYQDQYSLNYNICSDQCFKEHGHAKLKAHESAKNYAEECGAFDLATYHKVYKQIRQEAADARKVKYL